MGFKKFNDLDIDSRKFFHCLYEPFYIEDYGWKWTVNFLINHFKATNNFKFR